MKSLAHYLTAFTLLGTSLASGPARASGIDVVLGKSRYRVEALVINEGSEPVEIVFLNSGPHAGGCDRKSYVRKEIPARTMATVKEDWYCWEDQWFYIQVNAGQENQLMVKGKAVNLICNDQEGCRELGVR